jgi:hypothetical protein
MYLRGIQWALGWSLPGLSTDVYINYRPGKLTEYRRGGGNEITETSHTTWYKYFLFPSDACIWFPCL